MGKLPISISALSNAAENEKDSPNETNKSDSSKTKTKFSVPDEGTLYGMLLRFLVDAFEKDLRHELLS